MADLLEKQRHALNVVRAALDGAGLHDRDVWAGCANCSPVSECGENCAVFISAPPGADIEPYYETGATITEAVRKILASIKRHEKQIDIQADEQSGVTPF